MKCPYDFYACHGMDDLCVGCAQSKKNELSKRAFSAIRKYEERDLGVWAKPKRSKYNARQVTLDGYTYNSQLEARYAADLKIREKAGEVKSWRRQVPIKLEINGKLIATYKIDFVEELADGTEMWTEVKGFETDVWRLKWKMFEALHPEKRKQIVR